MTVWWSNRIFQAHNTQVNVCMWCRGTEGNAPTVVKTAALFRREVVSHIIKKCTISGAGGVLSSDWVNLETNCRLRIWDNGLMERKYRSSESQERTGAGCCLAGSVQQFFAAKKKTFKQPRWQFVTDS